MGDINVKIDKWKSKLLDLGKRNRLINYKETKRSSLKVSSPNMSEIWDKLVIQESYLQFEYIDEEAMDEEEQVNEENTVTNNLLVTNQSIKEQQKTLRGLRNKAKTAIEEQGVNILYLSFGFLKWKESDDSDQYLVSPIVLVPVTLTVETITSPFTLRLLEDEILINPTLAFKLENDFGIKLPELTQEMSAEQYLNLVTEVISNNKWEVVFETGLSLLSFLKINMYEDLTKNKEKIGLHPIIMALNGDVSAIENNLEELNEYDHDVKTKPYDVYQVVDADSSQQDAILCAKKGISFILQGPPGTGKSQTITNIISECLADGKKVLFVSEKMAALEVVYKRLSSAGLADFCLTLHSHKANKKEVMDQLKGVMNLSRQKANITDEAYQKLDNLQSNKEKLNEYIKAIHSKCFPLNKTVYEVNGKLANLQEYENIIFAIDNIETTTPEKLNQCQYALNQFASTIGKMASDYKLNPWKGSNVKAVTNELRHDITVNLGKLSVQMVELNKLYDEMMIKLEMTHAPSYTGLKSLEEILLLASKSPKVPIEWMERDDINILLDEVHVFSKIKERYKTVENELKQDFDDSYFKLDATTISVDFEEALFHLNENLNSNRYQDINSIIQQRKDILSYVENTTVMVDDLIRQCTDLKEQFGFTQLDTYKNSLNILVVLGNVLGMEKVIPIWFEEEQFIKAQNLFIEAKDKIGQYNEKVTNVCKEFDKEILDIDYQEMHKRFKTEYTSVLKIFNKNYNQDKKEIRGLYKTVVKKLEDTVVIKLLEQLKEIAELQKWIQTNQQDLENKFGKYYSGVDTKFEKLKVELVTFKDVQVYFDGKIPTQLMEAMLKEDRQKIKGIYNQMKKIIDKESISLVEDNLKLPIEIEKIALQDVNSILKSVKMYTEKFMYNYDLMEKYAVNKENYYLITDGINRLTEMQKIAMEIENKKEELKIDYKDMYKGINTDWDTVMGSLNWARIFKDKVGADETKKTFVKNICIDGATIELAGEYYNKVNKQMKDMETEWAWFIKLFDNDEALQSCNIFGLLDRIDKCKNGLASLEEWIDFRNARESCKEVGLGEYINKLEESDITANNIVPIFLKRFYKLWLDAILPQYPSILNFRSRLQNDIINEFSSLDKMQFDIAKARIKKTLMDKLPNMDAFTSGQDEVGILKRELNKQRRIMPLRKLFRFIPNLILTLKPCLMMSPLTVSLFLEAESYDFDVVIFDEASQVCTEDAIGAIIRGKQVIIAGDSKQLPPTSFFTASISDDDYDTIDDEESEEDVNAYESILDEAGLLPERTLLWHYRSRHEHLIAFSNAKIYKNNLITFPANVDRVKDNGVEYIYVTDGFYDRGGKKGNVGEANKVAELVFEHFRKFPNRSLGVIAFGEVQQQAIEYAVRQLRIKHKEFEGLFDEEREEPFFIKNLENVQGDERDTIIFSIGYGKDVAGKMYMSFGPLSKGGGERRLNVAITRAKYNVKLVGSIMPTDIDLERISAEGPKLLRAYIEFALRGPETIIGEVKENSYIQYDSPFEEAVYKYLDRKGYKLTTQVGCSGYRIDMAVKHPTISGRYVLGIECDGAAYHSARTARERDRLRQDVLEAMGWKIHRIWSTDWIKDPITEGQKLLQVVDEAINQYRDDKDIYNEHLKLEASSDFIDIEHVAIHNSTSNNNIYGFEYYEEADVRSVYKDHDDIKYLSNVIKHIVDKEYPIHFELLCKRVACLFGNQKATSKVRNSAEFVISKYLSDVIENRQDFYFLKTNPPIKVRIPKNDSDVRQISHISTEEVAEAMYMIANNCIGIVCESLYSETARNLGYNRVGTNITQAMEKACNYLKDNNRVKEMDGKIIIL